MATRKKFQVSSSGFQVTEPEELPAANSQLPIADAVDTSGGDEPEGEVNSEQLAVSSEPEPLSPQPLVLSPAPVRPQATDQVFVKCVVSQAVLDSRMMLQGEIRLVAYGLYRQAWAGNAAAFLVRLPGASGYIRETE